MFMCIYVSSFTGLHKNKVSVAFQWIYSTNLYICNLSFFVSLLPYVITKSCLYFLFLVTMVENKLKWNLYVLGEQWRQNEELEPPEMSKTNSNYSKYGLQLCKTNCPVWCSTWKLFDYLHVCKCVFPFLVPVHIDHERTLACIHRHRKPHQELFTCVDNFPAYYYKCKTLECATIHFTLNCNTVSVSTSMFLVVTECSPRASVNTNELPLKAKEGTCKRC